MAAQPFLRQHGDLDRVRELLADGAGIKAVGEYGNRPLHCATRGGHTEELLAAGAEIEEGRAIYGDRPLHYAARYGHTKVVKELLAAGADMEALNNSDERPLHIATKGGHAG